jgi:SSS family solute:Na+ symporter
MILGMLAKVAATQGMFDGVTDAATMDSEINHFMPDLWD